MSSSGNVDWAGGTDVEVLLVTATYTYNPDHNFVSDITNEITNGGYVRQNLTGRTKTENDASDRVEFDASDTTFPTLAAGDQPAAAIVFRNTGVDATSELICFNTLTAPPAPNGGDYTIVWAATGVCRLDN